MPPSADIPAVYLPYTWPGGQRRRPAPQRADAGTLAPLRYTPGTSPASRRPETSAGARKLKPRDGAPAAPSPAPPRCKAGNEVESSAVFRVAASGSRLRHPWPAPVGDLDPDNVVRRLDRDRDRLAGGTRAAMPQAIGEKLAHEQRGHVSARVTGAEQSLHERASQPRPVRPSRKRHGLPDRPPSHQRTRLPGRLVPGKSRACGRTHADARSTRRQTSRPDSPRNGHRNPRQAATHTAPWPRFPSAMRPWTPQHNALQRYKVTHDGTEKKRPASTRIRS
jgi:hypothetical protein